MFVVSKQLSRDLLVINILNLIDMIECFFFLSYELNLNQLELNILFK